MILVLAVMTFSRFAFDGPSAVTPVLLAVDIAAIGALAVPWHRLPQDAFASVGVLGILVTGLAIAPDDPMRQRLLMLLTLVGAGAVSPRVAACVGILGAGVALLPPGAGDPVAHIATAAGLLVIGLVVPALVAVVRPRPVARAAIAPAALNDYIAVLAHELSTPIVSIGAAAQVLARDLSGRAAERNALAIAEEARQVYALMESLSDLSALESGRLRLSLRTVDLGQLVRASASAAEGAAHHVALDLPDESVAVTADDRRIRQVLNNLIGNAAKYSQPGTQIEIRIGTYSDRRSAIVQVRDHGPGIPPAERGRIFEKFVRLSNAGGIRGSGLGLYISRAIVADHGGEIWGEWPAGGGSMFSFTLPLAGRRAAHQRLEEGVTG